MLRKPKTTTAENRDDLILLVVLLALFGLIAGYMTGQSASQMSIVADNQAVQNQQGDLLNHRDPAQQVTQTDSSILDRIDRHLKDANTKTDLKKKRVEVTNAHQAPDFYDDSAQMQVTRPDQVVPYGLEFEQQDQASSTTEAFVRNQPSAGDDAYLTPEDRINLQIERKKFAEEYDANLKQEYIRSFVRNAREGGLDVKLNKKLEVVNIRKINPDKPIRIPQSAVGQ